MGRDKKWSSKERERVAIAWTQATHDPVVGRNQSGETFDEKVYSLFPRKPPKDADPGTYSERSHPSVMTCFRNNISPDVMKFIGVLQMVKGVGLSGVNAEQLIHISVAVYLLKRKGEALPKSNSAFYLLKEADPNNWENFKAWNILKSTPKFLEPQGDASETTEEEDEEEDAASPPNEVNVEDQPRTTMQVQMIPLKRHKNTITRRMYRQHPPTSQAMIVLHQLLLLMLFPILHGQRNNILVETPRKPNYTQIKNNKSRQSCYLRCMI